jgi:hypothetical protein
VTTPTHATLPSPPRPAPAVLTALLVWSVTAAAAPPAATSVYARRTAGAVAAADAAPRPTEPPAEAAVRAERILASSLAMLAQADSFSARIRQKARVADRVLVGTGRYLQSGRGEDQRYRLESTLTCDTETFELTEVCDGLFAWTYRRNGQDAPQLERLDVRRVRDKVAQFHGGDPPTVSPYLGGLQRSMGTLRQFFRYVSAEPGEVDGVPVWVVDGRWNPDWLNVILPDLAAKARGPEGIAAAELPEGVPWSVRFSIGRTDLVPYRIEWLAIPGPRPVAGGSPEPIGVLELQEVRIGGPVDAGGFVYKPATAGLIDLTDTYVANLGPLRP